MENIRETLKTAIKNTYHLDFDPELTEAPDNIDADFSSNAPLKLAKELHRSPMEIAGELALVITRGVTASKEDPHGVVSDMREEKPAGPRVVVSAPGFLNFTPPEEYYNTKIADLATNFTENISSNEYQGQTVICEFSDPNPFKVLHVGHLYTSIVGDSISRLFEYAGARVIRANFGGDVGLHVAKTMYILQQKSLDDLTIDDIARCYVEGTAAYEDDESAKQQITAMNKQIYEINSENLHGTPLADLYWRGRELSYKYFTQFYDQIGVKFDKFYPESTVAGLGLAKVKEQLQNGVYEESDGAVVFDGDKYGLHTRVFINQEGVPTYEAKDVGLIFQKYQDYHFDKSVVITGNEQLEYMKVVLKSVEQYAPELVKKTTHLTHGLVKLPGNVKMSSRKGNFLKAVEVLGLVKDALKSEYNSSDDRIALAATKYALIKYKMGGNIIFDPSESVKMTGNSGPYLLYSVVRAKKILDKASDAGVAGVAAMPFSKSVKSILRVGDATGGTPAESGLDVGETVAAGPARHHNLSKKLVQYQPLLQEALHELAPHKIATYLYELAQEYSRFYENCPVIGSAEEAERLLLVQAYVNVMTHGLALLGITEIPEEM